MADPLEELAALEAGTGSETADEPEGTTADPEIPQVILDRYGDPRSDPEALAKLTAGYDELHRFTGRQGQEYGQTRQQLDELKAQMVELQQQSQPAPQEYGQELSEQEWEDWNAEKPLQAQAYLLAQNNQLMMQQIDERLNQSLSPIQADQAAMQSRRIANRLHDEFGEETFNRNFEQIKAEIAADPSIREGDADVVYKRLRRIVTDAEWERGNAATRGNGKPAAMRVEGGGSGGRPVGQVREEELSPADQIRREMLQNKPKRDRFQNVIRQP